MSVTIGGNLARASIQVVSLEATITYQQLAVSQVSYIALAVDAQLDVRGLYPVVFDSVYSADLASLQYAKGFTDGFNQTDAIQPFVLGKGLTETQSTAETHSFAVDRSIAESFGVIEDPSLDLVKAPFNDAVAQVDASSLGFFSPHSDQFIAQDGGQEFEGDYYADPTYFAEKYVSENRPIVDFLKSIAETVYATDDFDGEVTSEDDQTSVFGKAISDQAIASEVLNYVATYFRTLNDTSTSSDAFAALMEKALTDSAAASDALNSSVSKTASDSASTADSGYLYLSSYVDPTYFESDYSGTYQPF